MHSGAKTLAKFEARSAQKAVASETSGQSWKCQSLEKTRGMKAEVR